MKLWTEEYNINQLVEEFTIGNDHVIDLELAIYDVKASIAHAKMLQRIGILSYNEMREIEDELIIIKSYIHAGEFEIEEGIEDVHSQIEILLTRKLGETGKKLHTGRSRNDQVLTDLRLLYRDKLWEIIKLAVEITTEFLNQSDRHAHVLMPGFTHTQLAMVSSFGLWFASFGEALIDDIEILISTKRILNKNPLGSAAGYGSAFSIDRDFTTQQLDFDELCVNSIYAQFGRGKSEQFLANSISSLAFTLNKFASDVVFFNCQNLGLITLPEELTTGSSIMPNKKNPDVFELIRAKSNQILGLPNQVNMICHNLITGYHRDFQVLKAIIFKSLTSILDILKILHYCLPKLQPKNHVLSDPFYDEIFSVEEINILVNKGIPFRDAYNQIKTKSNSGKIEVRKQINHTHIGSLGNLGNDRIRARLNDLISELR